MGVGSVWWVTAASLRVDQSPSSLPKAKALGSEVFRVASFAVNLAILVGQGGGLEAFAALGTPEAGLMPGLPGTDHLLSRIDCLAASRAPLRAANLLRKLGGIGVGGGPVARGLLVLNAQRLPLVGAQRAGALPVAVAFGAVLLAVTRLAVDLFTVHGHSGAVQILLADHAQEAGFMEAAAFALNLFRKVNRLLAHPTFLASSPVRHPETGNWLRGARAGTLFGSRDWVRPARAPFCSAPGKACPGPRQPVGFAHCTTPGLMSWREAPRRCPRQTRGGQTAWAGDASSAPCGPTVHPRGPTVRPSAAAAEAPGARAWTCRGFSCRPDASLQM